LWGQALRIFEFKAVAEFRKREAVSDEGLAVAIETARRGLIDSNIGGGLIKQRVVKPYRRSGSRMLIGLRPDRAIVLFGFLKHERDNIDDKQRTTLQEIIASWFAADDDQIARALDDGVLVEVEHRQENKNQSPAD
jgi:hypothetical protein